MLFLPVQTGTAEPQVPGISACDTVSLHATEILSPRPLPNGAICNVKLQIKQQKDPGVVVKEKLEQPITLGGRDDVGTPGLDHRVGPREGQTVYHKTDPPHNSLRS